MNAGASQADINRVARRVSKLSPQTIVYEWVASNQDDKKSWEEPSLEETRSTECDMLAEEAIGNSLHLPARKQGEKRLPLEPASPSAGCCRQTGNPAPAVKQVIGHKGDKKFYGEELGWPKAIFNCVH